MWGGIRRRVQIVVSNKPFEQKGGGAVHPSTEIGVRPFVVGLLFAVFAVAVLIFALVVGSILSAVLWIVMVISVVRLIKGQCAEHATEPAVATGPFGFDGA